MTNTPTQLPMRSFPAIVVSRLSLSLDRVAAFGKLSDDILHDLGARTDLDNRCLRRRFQGAYNMVLRDSGVDARPAPIPPATLPMRRFPTTLVLRASLTSITNASLSSEAPDREAGTLTSLTRCPSSLPVLTFSSPRTQIASGPKALEQGESAWLLGALRSRRLSAQLYPVLADHYVLSVNSPHDDRVARIGSVYGLLDGLARPNDLALRTGEPTPAAGATPLATDRVRAMVVNNTMVRLIRRTAFLQGGGVSSVGRLYSQRPFISNMRCILPYRDRRITQMGYLWCCLGVA